MAKYYLGNLLYDKKQYDRAAPPAGGLEYDQLAAKLNQPVEQRLAVSGQTG